MRRLEVLRAWANQTLTNIEEANLRIEGPSLYSGDTLLASMLDRADEDGHPVVLCAAKVPQPWRAQHVRTVLREIDAHWLYVPNPVASPNEHQHRNNILYLIGSLRNVLEAAAFHETFSVGHYDDYQRRRQDLNAYLEAFDLPVPNEDLAFIEQLEPRARSNAERQRKQGNKVVMSMEYRRAMWRGRTIPDREAPGPVMLRMSLDEKSIETSNGDSIPVDIEQLSKLWRIVCTQREYGSPYTWRVLSERPKLGDYHVRSVRGDGTLVVDCHEIPFGEFTRIAVALRLK